MQSLQPKVVNILKNSMDLFEIQMHTPAFETEVCRNEIQA